MPVLTNIRYELFAQAVAKGADLVVAYEQAGFKRHDSSASRLRGNAKVSARIDEILKDAAVTTGITVERVTREVAAIAFLDIREVVEWGMRLEPARKPVPGRRKPKMIQTDYMDLKPSKDLPERVARAIAGVKKTKVGVEVKTYDKLAALIRLGSQLGMWKSEDKDAKGVDAIMDMIIEAHRAATGENAKVIEGERGDE